MASKTYVAKGYSAYTNNPTKLAGYDHTHNEYVVNTKTIERIHTLPTDSYIGSPSKVELLKEYVHSPPVSPVKHARGYFSEEPIRVNSRPGYVKTGHISDPPANNINEGLGLLEKSVSNLRHVEPRRRKLHDSQSTHVALAAQPLEPLRRYARPAFVNDPRK
ncbi:hypothetical protein R6Q59_005376 [Mikania micrantha]